MELKQAIEHILDGKAIIFTGSGFSTGARDQNNKSLKIGNQLSYFLCKELGVEEDDDLAYVSRQYIKRFGEDSLIKELKKLFKISTYSPSDSEINNYYRTYGDIDWMRIYTTNYDNLFEKILEDSCNEGTPVVLSEQINDVINFDNPVIHINGYIDKLNKHKLYNEFKLTRSSYINDDFTKSDWSMLFEKDIKKCEALIFIGYSMDYDLDINRIVGKVKAIKDKTIFITHKECKNKNKEKMLEFGEVYPIGVDGFAREIDEVKANYTSINKSEFRLKSISETKINLNSFEKVKDIDITNLFIRGIMVPELVEDDEYLVRRDELNMILKSLESDFDYVLLHSNLGNGKTCFLKRLEFELTKLGRVFNAENKDFFQEDIEMISKLPGLKFLTIDNYNLYLSELGALSFFKNKNLKVILTARTYINDNRYLKLLSKLRIQEKEILVRNINQLDQADIEKLKNKLSTYHLWGDYKKAHEKIPRQMKDFVLKFFKSKFVTAELTKLIDPIKQDQSLKEFLILIFTNTILNLSLTYQDIIKLLGKYSLYGKIDHGEITEFIKIYDDKTVTTSSNIASYILKQMFESDEIIDVIIKIFKEMDNYKRNKTFNEVKKMLFSNSSLKLIIEFNNRKNHEEIIRLYENIKNTSYCRKHPGFWLQYGISCIELKRYEEAEKYFQNAYSIGDEIYTNFDTFQIDTHYARLQLEVINQTEHNNDTFQIFKQAHDKIYNNKNKTSDLHYPLRHIKLYENFFEKHYLNLSDGEKVSFVYYCHQAKEKIDLYFNTCSINKKNPHSDVYTSSDAIFRILSKLDSIISV